MNFRRVLLLVAAAGAGCAAATAQIAVWPEPEPPHAVRIAIHADAMMQLESLATVTRLTRREQAACVTRFGAAPVARGGWLIAIIELGPGLVSTSSDSLAVIWHGALCARGEPNVHTHIVRNEVWGRPSDYDTSVVRADPAPFHVLVSVGTKAPSLITIYGLR